MARPTHDLIRERYGDPDTLARERGQRRQRGITAARCGLCMVAHESALLAGETPQPVRAALPGSHWCGLHQGGTR